MTGLSPPVHPVSRAEESLPESPQKDRGEPPAPPSNFSAGCLMVAGLYSVQVSPGEGRTVPNAMRNFPASAQVGFHKNPIHSLIPDDGCPLKQAERHLPLSTFQEQERQYPNYIDERIPRGEMTWMKESETERGRTEEQSQRYAALPPALSPAVGSCDPNKVPSFLADPSEKPPSIPASMHLDQSEKGRRREGVWKTHRKSFAQNGQQDHIPPPLRWLGCASCWIACIRDPPLL